MKRHTPGYGAAGFALTEALVALLLLATALMGAGATLVESLAGQRAALLQTRAADLAGDLAEALRSAADAATATAEMNSWRALVAQQLPQATPLAISRVAASPTGATPLLPTDLQIDLQWHDGRGRAPARLMLPLSIGALTEPH